MLKELFQRNLGRTVEVVSTAGQSVRGVVDEACQEYVTLTAAQEHRHHIAYGCIFRIHIIPDKARQGEGGAPSESPGS